MSEKILSPDGKQEWDGDKWIPLSGHSTAPGAASIVNYAQLCIDALNRGDMAGAKTYYDKAKELDFKVATKVFESEYALEIGTGYANIVETKLVQIVQTDFNANMQNFGMGVVNWDIDGDFEMDSHLQSMNIAFNNAAAFLGDPGSLISGGPAKVRSAFLKHYDPDGDGIADALQRELQYSDYDRMENDPILGKQVVKELEISKIPGEDFVKQQLRIGLCLESAGKVILGRLVPVTHRVAVSGDTSASVVLKFLNQKTTSAANASDEGRGFHLAASALSISAGYPHQQWKEEDFDVIIDTFHLFQEIYQEASEMISNRHKALLSNQSNTDHLTNTDCFIATAAYGTPYDSKIDVLRNWRDDSLREFFIGRKFIKIYYFLSPPIANIVSKSKILRALVRVIISPLIYILNPKFNRPRVNKF